MGTEMKDGRFRVDRVASTLQIGICKLARPHGNPRFRQRGLWRQPALLRTNEKHVFYQKRSPQVYGPFFLSLLKIGNVQHFM